MVTTADVMHAIMSLQMKALESGLYFLPMCSVLILLFVCTCGKPLH